MIKKLKIVSWRFSLIRAKKWYFDILTKTGNYFFFYFSESQILFFRDIKFSVYCCSAGNEVIQSGKNLTNIQLSEAINFTDLIHSGKHTISLDLDQIKINLNYYHSHYFDPAHDRLVVSNKKRQQTQWFPISLNSHISGDIRIGEKNFQFQNEAGYIDCFFSNMINLKPLFRSLHWGRITHDHIDVVYSLTSRLNESPLYQLIIRFNQQIYIYNQFELLVLSEKHSYYLNMNYPDHFEIHANQNQTRLEVQIKVERIAVESFFIKEMGFKKGWKLKLLTYLTKNPRTIKLISKADIRFFRDNEVFNFNDVAFISEYAEFESGVK